MVRPRVKANDRIEVDRVLENVAPFRGGDYYFNFRYIVGDYPAAVKIWREALGDGGSGLQRYYLYKALKASGQVDRAAEMMLAMSEKPEAFRPSEVDRLSRLGRFDNDAKVLHRRLRGK